MRSILSLAAWNWRMARRPYAILCAVFAVQQLAVLLYQAQTPDLLGAGLAASYSEGLQIYAFGITFLLAGLLAGPAVNDQKRARCSYTWLTLPLPPAARLAAQVLTAAVLQLGLVALQLVLYALYFFPVQVMQNAAVTQRIGQEAASMRFYEEVILNRGLYWLIPRRPLQAVLLALTLAAAALLLTAVRLHRGWRRGAALLIGVVCGFACMTLLQYEQFYTRYDAAYRAAVVPTNWPGALALLAVLLPFSVWWALRAIRRAEPA